MPLSNALPPEKLATFDRNLTATGCLSLSTRVASKPMIPDKSPDLSLSVPHCPSLLLFVTASVVTKTTQYGFVANFLLPSVLGSEEA